MIEIGSYRGESAEIFMNTGKISELFCVDTWKAGYDDSDRASFSDMAKVEADFDARMAKYGPRVRKFKGTLQQFSANGFPPVDFIYVDSCHTYDGCKTDLLTALEANPVYIGGHDYSAGFKGVIKAVNEYVGQPDKLYPDSSWLKKLK